jgi:hypothetical protein
VFFGCIGCRVSLLSSFSNILHFSHDRSNWSPSFYNTKCQGFHGISDLYSWIPKLQEIHMLQKQHFFFVSFLNLTPIDYLHYQARRNCNLKVCSLFLRDCAYWLPVHTASNRLILFYSTSFIKKRKFCTTTASWISHYRNTFTSGWLPYLYVHFLLNVLLAKAWISKVTFQQIERCRRFRVSKPNVRFFIFVVQTVTILLSQRDYANAFCKYIKYCFLRGLSLCGAFGSSTVAGSSTRQTDQTHSDTLTSLTRFLLTFDNIIFEVASLKTNFSCLSCLKIYLLCTLSKYTPNISDYNVQ